MMIVVTEMWLTVIRIENIVKYIPVGCCQVPRNSYCVWNWNCATDSMHMCACSIWECNNVCLQTKAVWKSLRVKFEDDLACFCGKL